MSVIQLVCTECGGDRFTSSAKSFSDEAVATIQCEKCSAQVKVDEVVWYQKDCISPARGVSGEKALFSDTFYLVPGS